MHDPSSGGACIFHDFVRKMQMHQPLAPAGQTEVDVHLVLQAKKLHAMLRLWLL